MPHRTLGNKSSSSHHHHHGNDKGSCRLTLTILCSLLASVLVCYLIAFGHVVNGGQLLKALQEHYHEQPPHVVNLLRRQMSSSSPTTTTLNTNTGGGTSGSSSSEEEEQTKGTNNDGNNNNNVVIKSLRQQQPKQQTDIMKTVATTTTTTTKEKVERTKNDLNIQIDLSVLPKTFSSRNLILGIASNLDAKNFAIFIQSLRWNAIDATAIIFLERPTSSSSATSSSVSTSAAAAAASSSYERIKQLSQEHNVILLEYSIPKDILSPTFLHSYHSSSLRWVFYHWLFQQDGQGQQASNGQESRLTSQSFDKILTVDIRDTVFQSNPFQLLPSSTSNSTELYTIGENPQGTIGACSWNSGWIRDCFGERILQLIKSFPIVCSGITLGSSHAMTVYIHKMGQILLNDFPCLNTNFPSCERNGVDQGIHNVLLYMGHLEPSYVKYPLDFPIINVQSATTVGGLKEMTVRDAMSLAVNGGNKPLVLPSPTDASSNANAVASSITPLQPPTKTTGKINLEGFTKLWMMPNGSPYAIVHQYDRHHDFQLSLAKRYISWIDFENPVNEWKTTSSCNAYGVVFGVDLLKGKCDLSSQRVLTPASCCELCSNQVTCTAFTYSGGTCYMKTCDYQTEIMPIVKLVQDPNFRDMTMTQPDTTSAYLIK